MSADCLVVAQALQSLLQQIRKADNFYTDAGANVFVQLDEFSEADNYPLLSVTFEEERGPEKGRRIGCPHMQMTGEFLVVGAVQIDSVQGDLTPLQLIKDIKRALFKQVAPAQLADHGIEIEHLDSTAFPHIDGEALNEIQVRVRAQWQELITP